MQNKGRLGCDDRSRDAELKKACSTGFSNDCYTKYGQMLAAYGTYNGKVDTDYNEALKLGLEKYTATARNSRAQ